MVAPRLCSNLKPPGVADVSPKPTGGPEKFNACKYSQLALDDVATWAVGLDNVIGFAH